MFKGEINKLNCVNFVKIHMYNVVQCTLIPSPIYLFKNLNTMQLPAKYRWDIFFPKSNNLKFYPA